MAAVSVLTVCIPSRGPETIPVMGYRRAVTTRPAARFRPVRREDLRVQAAAELALQIRPQAGEGRALKVFRARLLRLVLLDHDEPVATLVQRVEFDARFVMDPGDRLLEGRDHLGTVFGDGKGRDDDDNSHVGCFLLLRSFLRGYALL
jgi:hypothetical protein